MTVENNGHSLASVTPIFAPFFETLPTPGLEVVTGETLSLIGNGVILTGGLLKSPGGQLDIGGVAAGEVGIDWLSQGFSLNYAGVQQFSDVSLQQQSLLDASGAFGSTAGSIQLQGQRISLQDGSIVWNQNRGFGSAGDITVQAQEQITLLSTIPSTAAVSGIVGESVLAGDASSLRIAAPTVLVENGATITSRSAGSGTSGDVVIVADDLTVSGFATNDSNLFSVIGTNTNNIADAGNLEVNVHTLSVLDGAYLGASTIGPGDGGNVLINSESILVAGETPTAIASIISAITVGNFGNAGDIDITTGALNLREGGVVSTASLGIGNAGNVSIRASEQIDLNDAEDDVGSIISSTIAAPDPIVQQLLKAITEATLRLLHRYF